MLAVDTGTRHADPYYAADYAGRVALRLHRLGARRIYKKIDSTLRGPWVEEIAAVREALDSDAVLVSPAFPAQGRQVISGRVVVDGVPIVDCVEELRRRGSLRSTLLAPRAGQSVPDAMVAALRDGAEFIVVDAANESDLLGAVDGARSAGIDAVMAGSAGLAAAWAQRLAPRNPASDGSLHSDLLDFWATLLEERALAGTTGSIPLMVVVGSAQCAAREQLATLRRALAHERLPVTVLATPEPVDGEPEDREMARVLAEKAAERLRVTGSGAVVVCGGETGVQLLRALGVGGLDIWGELAPGLVVSHTTSRPHVVLVTKAGGFGDRDCLVQCAKFLSGHRK